MRAHPPLPPRNQQGHRGEAAEDDRAQLVRRHHLGANILECVRLLDRLLRRKFVNDARDSWSQCVRIACLDALKKR
jgi:hypothetical protein